MKTVKERDDPSDVHWLKRGETGMSYPSNGKTMGSTAARTTSALPKEPLPPEAGGLWSLDVDTPRKTVVRHVLPLYSDVLSDGFTLDVLSARGVGRSWAESGRSLDWLLEAVRSLSADLVERALRRPDLRDAARRGIAVRRISELGNRILVELAHGFGQACEDPGEDRELPRRQRAQLLLTGAVTPPAGVRYGVIAVAAQDLDPAAVDEVFRAHGGEQTLSLLDEKGGHVLLPAQTEADAAVRAGRALAALGGTARAALAWPDGRSLSACRSVADDILAEAVALGFAPAVHVLADVLLEFAAAHEPMVSNALLKVVQPLHAQPVLWETLQVLLAEDGNRGKAAERLIIHRSTIDYRLQRIGQVTGHDPCTVRGLRLLSTASAMHRLAELRRAAA